MRRLPRAARRGERPNRAAASARPRLQIGSDHPAARLRPARHAPDRADRCAHSRRHPVLDRGTARGTAVHALLDTAFRDHWGHVGSTAEIWQEQRTSRAFRPALGWVSTPPPPREPCASTKGSAASTRRAPASTSPPGPGARLSTSASSPRLARRGARRLSSEESGRRLSCRDCVTRADQTGNEVLHADGKRQPPVLCAQRPGPDPQAQRGPKEPRHPRGGRPRGDPRRRRSALGCVRFSETSAIKQAFYTEVQKRSPSPVDGVPEEHQARCG